MPSSFFAGGSCPIRRAQRSLQNNTPWCFSPLPERCPLPSRTDLKICSPSSFLLHRSTVPSAYARLRATIGHTLLSTPMPRMPHPTENDLNDLSHPPSRLISIFAFCTPYYGFVPGTEVDLFVEILQLSSFLCTCCFSTDGHDLPQLGDSVPTAAALLSMLSAIPNDRPGGSIAVPWHRCFICAPVPQAGACHACGYTHRLAFLHLHLKFLVPSFPRSLLVTPVSPHPSLSCSWVPNWHPIG